MMRVELKKGDVVIVKKGKDRGKTGKVLKVIPDKRRIVVEKVNFVKEFIRPDRRRNIQGGIMEKEAPLAIANAMIYCSECQQGVRIKKKTLEDGTKMRVCHKCGLSLERLR